MLPVNEIPAAAPAWRGEQEERGMGAALFGGWAGGGLFAGLALGSGLGWLAALLAYSLGGALLVLVIAALPLIEARLRQPALRPAFARIRRRS